MDKNYLIQLTAELYQLTLLFPKKDPLRYRIRELGTEILASSSLILNKPFDQSKDLVLNIKDKIEVLNCFFEVVKTLNWVKDSKVLEIQKEYDSIKREVERSFVENSNQLRLDQLEKEETENAEDDVSQALQVKEKDLPSPAETPFDFKDPFGVEESIEDSNFEKSKIKKISSKKGFFERKEKILEALKEKGKAQVGDFKKIFPRVTKRTIRRDFRYLLNQGLIEREGERNETFYRLREKRLGG